jgi:hypothetical protein
VALVLLRDLPLFRHVIPSKIFEAWGTGRPVILGVAGESAEIVQTSQGGLVIQPESAEALACSIAQLAATSDLASDLGRNGRRFVTGSYDRELLARQMLDVLTGACQQ